MEKKFLDFSVFCQLYQKEPIIYNGVQTLNFNNIWPNALELNDEENSNKIIIAKECLKQELETYKKQIDVQIKLSDKYPNNFVEIIAWSYELDELITSEDEEQYFIFIYQEKLLTQEVAIQQQNFIPNLLINLFNLLIILNENQIIHGNIKPNNIFISNQQIKLADFNHQSSKQTCQQDQIELVRLFVKAIGSINKIREILLDHNYGELFANALDEILSKSEMIKGLEVIIYWKPIKYEEFCILYPFTQQNQNIKSLNGQSQFFNSIDGNLIKKIEFSLVNWKTWSEYIEQEIKTQMKLYSLYPDQILKINHWSQEISINQVNVYIAYEYSENSQSLLNYISKFPLVNDSDKMRFIEKILLLGCVLESSKIPHRNLKDSNIIFINNKIKLTDFGSARTHNQQFGLVSSQENIQLWQLHSYFYQQPEFLQILDNDQIGIRDEKWQQINEDSEMRLHNFQKNDVWALGIMILQILTNSTKYDVNEIQDFYGKKEIKIEEKLAQIEQENQFAIVKVLRSMLKMKSNERCTAEEAYKQFMKTKENLRRQQGIQQELNIEEFNLLMGDLQKLKLIKDYQIEDNSNSKYLIKQKEIEQIQKQILEQQKDNEAQGALDKNAELNPLNDNFDEILQVQLTRVDTTENDSQQDLQTQQHDQIQKKENSLKQDGQESNEKQLSQKNPIINQNRQNLDTIDMNIQKNKNSMLNIEPQQSQVLNKSQQKGFSDDKNKQTQNEKLIDVGQQKDKQNIFKKLIFSKGNQAVPYKKKEQAQNNEDSEENVNPLKIKEQSIISINSNRTLEQSPSPLKLDCPNEIEKQQGQLIGKQGCSPKVTMSEEKLKLLENNGLNTSKQSPEQNQNQQINEEVLIFPNQNRQENKCQKAGQMIQNHRKYQIWSTNKIIYRFQKFMINNLQTEINLPAIPSQLEQLLQFENSQDYVETDNFKYFGYLQNDQPHGQGIRMNKSTGAIYSGIFNQSKFLWGIVLEVNKVNVLCRYIGEYDSEVDFKHGFGKYEWWIDQTFFCMIKFTLVEWMIGWSVFGSIEGYGKRYYQNEVVYEGFWKNGKREGKGRLLYPKSEEKVYVISYEGEFQNGCYHGKGMIKFSDGREENGFFQNDYQLESGLEQENLNSNQQAIQTD